MAQNQNQELNKKEENKNVFIIPECCVSGWDDCSHTPKPQEKREINPAL